MQKSVSIHARIKPELKNSVEGVLDKLGITTSDAIKIFFNQIVLTNGLPFEIKIPNLETQQALNDIHTGKNIISYKNTEEMFKELGI